MKKVLKCKPPVQFPHVSRVKIIWPGDFSAISDNSCAHANHIATYIKKSSHLWEHIGEKTGLTTTLYTLNIA